MNAVKEKGRAELDEVVLSYELRGRGDAVFLIHWGVGTIWAEPLLEQAALTDDHLLVTYDRAGFGRSSRVDGPIGIVDHARHCRLLMRHLGLEHAHVIGHSSSAVIALQLALDAPDAVRTLVLLESARPVPQTELQAAFLRDVVGPAVQRYQAGDPVGAVDAWFTGVFGADYRPRLDALLPGASDGAVAEADAFFARELPALQQWSFGEDDAHRVTQPVLLVLGEHTSPSFVERHDLLLSWLPRVESFVLRQASHLLHIERPAGLADALAAFFERR